MKCLRLSSMYVFEPSVKCLLRFKVRFRQKRCQRVLFFFNIWQLLMEALFFQEHAHSTYGHLKISSSPRWRKLFGIRRKQRNVQPLRTLSTSFPSRPGSLDLKAFASLFVQPIYFDCAVYSSEERKMCRKQQAFHDETTVYGSSKFVKFGKKAPEIKHWTAKRRRYVDESFKTSAVLKLITLCLKTVRFG